MAMSKQENTDHAARRLRILAQSLEQAAQRRDKHIKKGNETAAECELSCMYQIAGDIAHFHDKLRREE